ncbi:MAG: YfcE family phosphodiesterase [Pseudomonadales bacterium]|nr:YfcE family phosphodiesterase [Pseudomonadales bacterium]MCP5185406.1 YfcE family phosphodiesterase [Pseudomonadales bacterium]
MRIGIVGDTHNNLKNVARIVELFNEAGVARVIHTGDISQPKTLDAFTRLTAPLYGVFGNNDVGEQHLLSVRALELGFHFVTPPLHLAWHGRNILVVHDPLEADTFVAPHHDVVIHGHTHLYRHELTDGRLVFNPGECAGHMRGYNAIGVVDLSDLSTRLLKF